MSKPNKGTYVLVLHLEGEEEITVGKLGTFTFSAGYYLYVGSALGPGGLEARLARHRRHDKKLRWHIDYLLERARLVDVWSVTSTEKLECLWAQAAQEIAGAEIPVPGFGSSDCRCPSHLIYLARKPFSHPNRPQSSDDARQVVANIGQLEAPAGDEFLVEFIENSEQQTKRQGDTERGRPSPFHIFSCSPPLLVSPSAVD